MLCIFLLHLKLATETPVELLHTASRVKDACLVTGVEGMALRTNVDAYILLGGTYIELLTTCTYDVGCIVLGMYALAHQGSPLLSPSIAVSYRL